MTDEITVAIGPTGQGITGSTSLEVDALATPLPAALPLFASALGGLGLLGWRRKKTRSGGVIA